MGLMPIIFTALTIFIVSTAVILLISYIMYKMKPSNKPYLEIKKDKPVLNPPKSYYAVPVYTASPRKTRTPAPRPKIRYNDVNRFEVLNQPKPVYMQSSEARPFIAEKQNLPSKNIYEFYSNDFNEGNFRAVTL